MGIKIGIFKMEQQAVDAVQALEKEGFSKEELKVLAKDKEHSRRIESETDMHADEMKDLTETRESMDNDFFIPAVGLAGAGWGYGGSAGVTGSVNPGAPYYGAGVLAGYNMLDDETPMEDALQALGLRGGDAEKCRDAIAEGALVVTADTGADKSTSGGPDLSRGGTAEAVFRQYGAEEIL